MRFLYATLLSLAIGLVGHSVQAQPAGNNRPQAPETFMRELVEGVKELTVAVKAIPTEFHVKWGLAPDALVGVGIACGSAILCVFIAAVALVIVIPRRQA